MNNWTGKKKGFYGKIQDIWIWWNDDGDLVEKITHQKTNSYLF